MQIWIVDVRIRELMFDRVNSNYFVFSSEDQAEEFSEKYSKKWREFCKDKEGFGSLYCKISGPFELNKTCLSS